MAQSILRQFVLREPHNLSSLLAFIKQNWEALAKQGKPIVVTISGHKAMRSADQNKRYWAILGEIANTAWVGGKQFPAEAWHEFYKRKFLGCEEIPNGGLVGISTTVLSIPEFSEYSTKVEEYAASELGVEFL